MKTITVYFIIALAMPVSVLAQYSGGSGKGDVSTLLSNILLPFQENAVEIPAEFYLAQNYPNPLNPSTKIQYSIPNRSRIIIKVFNILGSELATLLEEERSAGTYEITWNADNLPSGIYCYQMLALPTGNGEVIYAETKKMVLLR